MIDPNLQLMSTGELLSSIAEDLLEIQIREHLVLRKIAELDRRGAAAELGHKDLVQVFKHRFRWDVRLSRHRIKHARLITTRTHPDRRRDRTGAAGHR